MDIAYSFMKDGKQWARIYRSIDPESIYIDGGKIYFAHHGAWQHNLYCGRYCLPLSSVVGVGFMSTDPEDVKRIQETIPGRDYGMCVETFSPDA